MLFANSGLDPTWYPVSSRVPDADHHRITLRAKEGHEERCAEVVDSTDENHQQENDKQGNKKNIFRPNAEKRFLSSSIIRQSPLINIDEKCVASIAHIL